jgi:hypothetical protein
MNNTKITPISEIEADKRRLCEIRFDCQVSMTEYGARTVEQGLLSYDSKSLPPQWFRMNSQITLESIKYMSEVELGSQLKQMYYELQAAIAKYEQYR